MAHVDGCDGWTLAHVESWTPAHEQK